MSLRLVLLWSSYFADLFLRVVRLILFNRLSAFDIYFLIVVPYLLRVLDAFDSNVISVRPDTVLIKGGIMSIHTYIHYHGAYERKQSGVISFCELQRIGIFHLYIEYAHICKYFPKKFKRDFSKRSRWRKLLRNGKTNPLENFIQSSQI